MTWPFGALQPLSYDLIMVDPSTEFENWSERGDGKSPQAHYDTMTIDEIAALPVGHLARGDAVLFLWATFPLLPEALFFMRSWGFKYVTGGAWHKRTIHGKTAFGTGYRVRSATEPFLIGTVGRPLTSRAHRNIIEGLRREHSRKPDEAYRWCESYMPGARRADVFSRQTRPGWESCGNEATKFDEAAA